MNTNASSSPRAARFSRVELVMTILLALFLFMLAIRGFLVPAAAAEGFGIAIANPADLFYLHVKADRDLSSALAVTVLLALGERRALAAFVGVSMVQPALDAALSIADPRGHLGYALAVHGSAVVYGVVLLALLLRRREA